MQKIKEALKSVKSKLFLAQCLTIVFIIVSLIIINNVVLEVFYVYTKTNVVRQAYTNINSYYNNPNPVINIETELVKLAEKNDIDILIEKENGTIVCSTDSRFINIIQQSILTYPKNRIIYRDNDMKVYRLEESDGSESLLLHATLDNGNVLYIRVPIASIHESVRISNDFLILIGMLMIIISAIIASFVSKKFMDPIIEMNLIAKKMANLDFSKRYRIKDTDDEINYLGRSLNTMSDKLEITIKQLRANNNELEKDIEEKSKIDEMRKQFISDVSHELKTPIALIQGYAEGLSENIDTDEESRKFYTDVILDETNKMDILVKQLLELMKLEYESRTFNNTKFNFMDMIKDSAKKCELMAKENSTQIEIDNIEDKEIFVYADQEYMGQVLMNYLTNAIKHVEPNNEENKIVIRHKILEKNQKVRIYVFNTGNNIPEEELNKIWRRFYKVDSSRNREAGGTGIGLSLVKAIMNNYKNKYGVTNKANGVEFYFDIDLYNKQDLI